MTLALALVGCGGMGRRHIQGMEKLHLAGKMQFELAAVCDMLPENARLAADSAAEKLGRRPAEYHDFEIMLRNIELDAVIITTTPETHLHIGLAALAAGLHVMVEKPITLTVSEGRRLVEAARSASVKLAVAENYRRDPINRLGKALVDSGAVGSPYLMVQASSGGGEYVIITPWRHLRQSGGIVVDMGVHYGDILEYYLGPLQQVYGLDAVVDQTRIHRDSGSVHTANAEDLSVGVARFTGGALAHWMLNMAGRGEGFFHRAIYGTGGSLVIPSDRSGKPLRLNQRQNGTDISLPDSALLELVPDFQLDEVTAALFGGDRISRYDLEWRDIDSNLLGIEQADFVAAVVEDRPPEVTGEQGLRSLAVVFGFLEAGRLGRAVTLNEILNGATTLYEAEIAGSG
ncbi:MAG TPA: Gfo/Idh/MocA family oxidoreductase [Spirillospora sp.]|nr:Gfo/Idh/MocA family oxidoreductase [Spirillospora sp.]